MQLVHIENISIPETRQRQEFNPDRLVELMESVQIHGLLHAIVLRDSSTSPTLVAGERRLRAIKDLWQMGGVLRFEGKPIGEGWIPCSDLGELTHLQAMEAELEENVRRTDLTWQERAKATADLADLRRAQAVDQGRPIPDTSDIAEEVRGSGEGYYREATRRELIVSRHLHNPEVAKAQNINEAWKILKRKEEVDRNVELAATIGQSFKASIHELLREDSLEWMAETCSAEAFDVILADPPYGVNADEFGDSGKRDATFGQHFYEDSPGNLRNILEVFAPQSYRIAKPQAHLYVFCDIDWFAELRSAFSAAGWHVHRTPIIWHKPGNYRTPWPEHGPQRKWEMILYAVKGSRPVTRIFPDLVSYNPDDNLGHQAQKPVALYSDLLRRSVRPGDTVCDPFCGSGTIFPAAHELKCKAVGIEKEAHPYGLAVKRLQDLQVGDDLLKGLE